MMKKRFLYFGCLIALTMGLAACGDDDESLPSVKPTETGTMTDNDGNEYQWVRIGNLDWMASNLKSGDPWYTKTYITDNGMEGDFDVDDEEAADEAIQTDGNYYSYQEALDQCPDGWRLPTDDDWKALESALGMSSSELDKEGWRDGAGYLMAQTIEEGTGLHLLYVGQLAPQSTAYSELTHYGDYGYYWSATVAPYSSAQNVYIRKICPLWNKVERSAATTTARFMSVRYCRDAE